ncbi:riboflavin synthase [Desulfitibacter alkalitolerans]|uniref:riboflavin synthase n=1 Tax=Desulfitibacter alkalitolerans TaxID=264641 RepID=UPI0004896F4F|nr:riboflavin synthase [Desulfitibacter alkalitolerans]
MFTGLIEDLGEVREIDRGAKSARLTISTKINLEEVKVGDSIAVNGVCLTVIKKETHGFTVEVMWETIQKTNFKSLLPGTRVNLERALQLGGRLDGHMVSGHVDGVGTIVKKDVFEISEVIEIETNREIIKYLIRKGSVSIDGISLTIVDVLDKSFSVSLIPHTREKTTLGVKKIGDTVNLEVDMLAKYIERLLSSQQNQDKGVTYQKLIENGFI